MASNCTPLGKSLRTNWVIPNACYTSGQMEFRRSTIVFSGAYIGHKVVGNIKNVPIIFESPQVKLRVSGDIYEIAGTRLCSSEFIEHTHFVAFYPISKLQYMATIYWSLHCTLFLGAINKWVTGRWFQCTNSINEVSLFTQKLIFSWTS